MMDWLLLGGLLAAAVAAIVLLRARLRPAVEAGPKAAGHDQADPAVPAMIEAANGAPGEEAAGEGGLRKGALG